jgi:hypothetical protein
MGTRARVIRKGRISYPKPVEEQIPETESERERPVLNPQPIPAQ